MPINWRLLYVFVTFLLLLPFQNCSPNHQLGQNSAPSQLLPSSGGTGVFDMNKSLMAYEKTLYPLTTQHCARCHGVNQQPLHSLPTASSAHDILLSFNLVDLQSPGDSRLVQKIAGGHSSLPNSLSAQLEAAIAAWGNDYIQQGGQFDGEEPVLEARFSSIFQLIIQPKCLSCHNPSGSRPQEDFTDYFTTINSGTIEAYSANQSDFYETCVDGDMPRNGTPLSNEELSAIRSWIDAGALNN